MNARISVAESGDDNDKREGQGSARVKLQSMDSLAAPVFNVLLLPDVAHWQLLGVSFDFRDKGHTVLFSLKTLLLHDK